MHFHFVGVILSPQEILTLLALRHHRNASVRARSLGSWKPAQVPNLAASAGAWEAHVLTAQSPLAWGTCSLGHVGKDVPSGPDFPPWSGDDPTAPCSLHLISHVGVISSLLKKQFQRAYTV